MNNVLSIFVLGLSYGLVLFLLATGLTLTMGLLRVVNMSHGALYMVAGFLGIWVFKQTGSWILGVIAGGVLAALLGLGLEVAFLRRLYKNPASQVLLTIGIINIINNLTQWIFGSSPLSVPVPKIFDVSVKVGSVMIPTFRFFIIGFGIIMAVLLWFLQDRTRAGAMVRAGMDNMEIAQTLGMNNKLLFTAVFVLGSLIAGVTSLIGGNLTQINLGTSWEVLLLSIIVVVVGGTGSIQGALLGGVLIGLVNSFGSAYFPKFSSFIIYTVLILVLLFRPSGLLGGKTSVDRAVEAAAGPSAVKFRRNPLLPDIGGERLGKKRERRLFGYRGIPYLIGLVFLVFFPMGVGSYAQGILYKILIYALFAMSLDVIMGYLGMRSFGHAAFFGLGGYCVGLIAKHAHIDSFWLILIATIAICAIMSAVIGYFTLRLKGTYFLMVTMAFGQLLSVIASKWYTFTGGTDGLIGMPKPNLGFVHITWNSTSIYFFVLIMFVICYIILHIIMHSAYGRTLVAVRENEGRMRSLGYNTWRIKYIGVIISGVFAGIAGLLFAYSYGTMTPPHFGLETSALPMLMVIIGGGATLWGPALGAAVIVLVQTGADAIVPGRWPLILGAVYVLCVLFLNGGFARYLGKLWYKLGELIVRAEKKERSDS